MINGQDPKLIRYMAECEEKYIRFKKRCIIVMLVLIVLNLASFVI